MSKHQTSKKRPSWEAIGAIAGVAGVIIALVAYMTQAQGSPTTQQSSASSGVSTQTVGSASTEPQPTLFKDIQLHQHAAVDLDGSTPTVSAGEGGITGNNDIYHDATPVSSSRLYTATGLYVYKDNPAKAYSACTSYLADTTHTFDTYMVPDIGRSFCFRTSEGRLASVQVTAQDGSPGKYDSITMNAQVWDK